MKIRARAMGYSPHMRFGGSVPAKESGLEERQLGTGSWLGIFGTVNRLLTAGFVHEPSSDYFHKTRQLLAGIEIDPFAGQIRICQTIISPALNPYQIHPGLNRSVGFDIFHW
jgi:hypothetical protein